jgi:hypothetical protein
LEQLLLSSDVDFDVVDSFDRIRAQLFRLLVLDRLGPVAEEAAQSLDVSRFILHPVKPFDFIRIVPVADRVPIMINRGLPDTGYWDATPAEIGPSDAELLFVDLFDYDLRGYRELSYYRVRIRNFVARSDLQNRAALLPVECYRAYLVES